MRIARRAGQWLRCSLICLSILTAPLLNCVPVAAEGTAPSNLFRTAFEYGWGRRYDEELKRIIGPAVTLDGEERAWVLGVFADLVAKANRRDVRYTLQVLESELVNAFSAPGGFIYVTTALLQHLGDDTDALANVLGHEIAHVELRHGIEYDLRVLELALWARFGSPETQQGETWDRLQEMGVEVVGLGWSRQLELEADALGQQLAAAAGYDPHGLSTFFEIVRLVERVRPDDVEFGTHPPTPKRIQRAGILADSLSVAERRRPKPEPPADAVPVEVLLQILTTLVDADRD